MISIQHYDSPLGAILLAADKSVYVSNVQAPWMAMHSAMPMAVGSSAASAVQAHQPFSGTVDDAAAHDAAGVAAQPHAHGEGNIGYIWSQQLCQKKAVLHRQAGRL